MKILLIVYDNDSYIHWFPQGIAYIASGLQKQGYIVEIYNQDFHHYPDHHLTYHLDNNEYDIVGVGIVGGYYQYRQLLKISAAINKSKNRPFYVLGGHGPSPEPEYFMKKTNADAVVIGEGEITMVSLLEKLGGNGDISSVKGIAYRTDSGEAHVNPRRPLISDLDSLPLPAYELFPMEYYRLLRLPHASNSDFVFPVLSGRGCTFSCNFCYRMDEGFRPRSNESIIDEIKFLRKTYGINFIAFSDELLMSSTSRTISLCEDIIKAELGIKWECNGRLNYAKPEILQLMRKSGCVFINYGIEAMDDQILKNMNKALTTSQIINGIEATLKADISPGFNIIFGNIGENKKTLQKGVDFLLKYDDGAQMRTIRPVTPYPGSPLYYHALEKGMIKDCEDFYENKHTNSDLLSVNFTDLSDEEFNKALFEGNETLLRNYYEKSFERNRKAAQNLYFDKDKNFRGFRRS